jgi:hypothetical protein
MRQFPVMHRSLKGLIGLMIMGLSACSLPAPYQTYSPGTAPAPAPPPNALTIYGATTTTPENQMDTVDAQIADTPPVPASTPAATPTGNPRIAICYSRMWNSAATVRDAATLACGANGAPRLVNQDTDLTACPVLTPTHAVYACTP